MYFGVADAVRAKTVVERTPTVPFGVPEAGLHALDFRYANGNGLINTENKCAIRTLRSSARALLGTVVP